MKRRTLVPIIVGMFTFLAVACDTDGPTTPNVQTDGPSFALIDGSDSDAAIRQAMGEINAQLEADGKAVRLEVVEWLAGPGSELIGRTVYFSNVGPMQLDADFVPGDPGRGGRMDITWTTDLTELTADLPLADTEAAVARAMATWDQETCATIPLTLFPDYGLDLGYVQYLVGLGGLPGWVADYTHAGWLPGQFFDIIGGPGASNNILGATFTFVWVSDPTVVAFRETYYNDKFAWQIDANIDVETVVLHETGHGLSQAHFGALFRTDNNGLFHFAPEAVMNAGYTGVRQSLLGTDVAGHCSIWSSWPEN